ncbi:isoleucine--tRNA ligase [archaeon]|nr:isoleucine--tRNA ligase [archaeon]
MSLEREQQVKEYWEKEKIPEKAIEKGNKKWFFLDGPPYATGNIHMGTALNKILKDYYIRYKRMHGFRVWSQPGYDTHGLPTENKVEKELGIKNKNEIETVGVEKFVETCRKFATQHINTMNQQFADLGIWMDWKNPYKTLKPEYIEGCWHTFKKGVDKGLFYEGKYPVHVCPRCETVVAYNEIVYEEKEDTSAFVKFKLQNKDEHLLIWTTTPWTLPSNTGVMVNPEFKYTLVETMAGKLWIAKELVPTVMEKLETGYTPLKTIKGKDMQNWKYDHPLDLPLQKDIQGKVVLSKKYVNLEAGTGLVHTAPGHGQEDYEVGKENALPALNPVKMNGKYNETVGKYTGLFVKKADPVIIEDLRTSGHLILTEDFKHEYPLCWRCNTPLLFLTVPQMFFKVTKIRDKLLKQNAETNWTPNWAGKRFQNWLESLGDWPISRQRYWGTPVPIWKCECGKMRVIETLDELPGLKDPHRPYIDKITFDCECGKKMKRVPDVLDVWFDSGVAPWASLGHPKKEQPFKDLWPVDFVLEGSDQTRGWWNSLTICGIITKNRIPFENVMQHGLVLDQQGRKMSKSKGTAINPHEVIEKHSRDILRYFLLRYNPSEDFAFSWKKCEDLKKTLNTFDNCIRFVELYCKEEPSGKLNPEDQWIISKVNSLQKTVEQYSNSFQGYKAVEAIEEFMLNDFSRWYIKLVRDRTWPTYTGKDKASASATMRYVTKRLLLLLAPVIPFTTEDANQKLFKRESIHLQEWPEPEHINKTLEQQMEEAKHITELCLTARQEAKIKLRWPLREMIVHGPENIGKTVKKLSKLLEKTCNVKKVSFKKKNIKPDVGVVIELNTKMDDELLTEALASELTRTVQQMRKKQGLKVENKIILCLNSDNKTNALLIKAKPLIVKKVNAVQYEIKEKGEPKELIFRQKTIKISFSKA